MRRPGETGAAELRKFASVGDFKQYLGEQVETRQSTWWEVIGIGLGAPSSDVADAAPGAQGQPKIKNHMRNAF